jgi:hypothetical protein
MRSGKVMSVVAAIHGLRSRLEEGIMGGSMIPERAIDTVGAVTASVPVPILGVAVTRTNIDAAVDIPAGAGVRVIDITIRHVIRGVAGRATVGATVGATFGATVGAGVGAEVGTRVRDADGAAGSIITGPIFRALIGAVRLLRVASIGALLPAVAGIVLDLLLLLLLLIIITVIRIGFEDGTSRAERIGTTKIMEADAVGCIVGQLSLAQEAACLVRKVWMSLDRFLRSELACSLPMASRALKAGWCTSRASAA